MDLNGVELVNRQIYKTDSFAPSHLRPSGTGSKPVPRKNRGLSSTDNRRRLQQGLKSHRYSLDQEHHSTRGPICREDTTDCCDVGRDSKWKQAHGAWPATGLPGKGRRQKSSPQTPTSGSDLPQGRGIPSSTKCLLQLLQTLSMDFLEEPRFISLSKGPLPPPPNFIPFPGTCREGPAQPQERSLPLPFPPTSHTMPVGITSIQQDSTKHCPSSHSHSRPCLGMRPLQRSFRPSSASHTMSQMAFHNTHTHTAPSLLHPDTGQICSIPPLHT